jgi:hypothetical protein
MKDDVTSFPREDYREKEALVPPLLLFRLQEIKLFELQARQMLLKWKSFPDESFKYVEQTVRYNNICTGHSCV